MSTGRSFLVFRRKRTTVAFWEMLKLPAFDGLCAYLDTDDYADHLCRFVPVITHDTPDCLSGLTVVAPRDETKQWMVDVLQSRSILPHCPGGPRLEATTTVSMLWKKFILVENDAVILATMKSFIDALPACEQNTLFLVGEVVMP